MHDVNIPSMDSFKTTHQWVDLLPTDSHIHVSNVRSWHSADNF